MTTTVQHCCACSECPLPPFTPHTINICPNCFEEAKTRLAEVQAEEQGE